MRRLLTMTSYRCLLNVLQLEPYMDETFINNAFYRCLLNVLQLEPYMDETFINNAFLQMGHVVMDVKIIKDRNTG